MPRKRGQVVHLSETLARTDQARMAARCHLVELAAAVPPAQVDQAVDALTALLRAPRLVDAR